MIYRHLSALQKEPSIVGDGMFAEPVVSYLRKSLDWDPGCLPATLDFAFREGGDEQHWHALADEAAERFPTESAVLMQAIEIGHRPQGVQEGGRVRKRRYLALVRSFPPDREPERFQTYRAAFETLHTAIGSLRSCWLSTAARSRGLRRPVCRRRRRAGTAGFRGPGDGAARRGDPAGADAVGRGLARRRLADRRRRVNRRKDAMDPSLKETLLDRLSSYLDGLDAADAETAGLAPTAAAPSADEEARDLFSVFVELAAVRNEARAQARIVKEALDQFRAVFETLQSRACCERRPISPGYCRRSPAKRERPARVAIPIRSTGRRVDDGSAQSGRARR